MAGPFAEGPAGDGEDEVAAEQGDDAVDAVLAVELAVDPGEPDGGAEEEERGELLEGFHPGAGAGEDAGPLGLHGQQEVGESEAEAEGGEDEEGHPGGLGEGEADGGTHERSGAGGGDDGGEDSGEEAAGEALLVGEVVAGGGEGEADFELSGHGKAEEEQERGEDGDEAGGLELEAPAKLVSGAAENEQRGNEDPEGDEDAQRVDESLEAAGGIFPGCRS